MVEHVYSTCDITRFGLGKKGIVCGMATPRIRKVEKVKVYYNMVATGNKVTACNIHGNYMQHACNIHGTIYRHITTCMQHGVASSTHSPTACMKTIKNDLIKN